MSYPSNDDVLDDVSDAAPSPHAGATQGAASDCGTVMPSAASTASSSALE